MCFRTPPGCKTESDHEALSNALKRTAALDRDWCDDGKLIINAARKHLATLPKPPRKVTVTAFATVSPAGTITGTYSNLNRAKSYAGAQERVVDLSREYEEVHA